MIRVKNKSLYEGGSRKNNLLSPLYFLQGGIMKKKKFKVSIIGASYPVVG